MVKFQWWNFYGDSEDPGLDLHSTSVLQFYGFS